MLVLLLSSRSSKATTSPFTGTRVQSLLEASAESSMEKECIGKLMSKSKMQNQTTHEVMLLCYTTLRSQLRTHPIIHLIESVLQVSNLGDSAAVPQAP